MAAKFQHFDLHLVRPSFDSELMGALMDLNHLRRFKLRGKTTPWLFFQLKEIFQMLESVGSAKIEGNRTTISEYVDQKIESKQRSSDKYSEIANVEAAMYYLEESIEEGSQITHRFIRELHQIVVDDLEEEGDKTPGAYRSWSVKIAKSNHLPPGHLKVLEYMDQLLDYINRSDGERYDLIKVAQAHHRFAWIHPFGNGNGRVVRLLTYALLIKYGFKVKEGQILNPTAVFCNDRDKYYEMLSIADKGSDENILSWSEYVLVGINNEIAKVNRLLDHDYLSTHVLKPAISLGRERGYFTKEEESILKLAAEKQTIKSMDIQKIMPKLSARQITHVVSKLKSNGFIRPIKKNGREYGLAFSNNYLMRSLVWVLEKEGFIPAIGR